MKVSVRFCRSLALALGAGLGCAPVVSEPARPEPPPEPRSEASDAGVFNGVIKNSVTREPIANAMVVLQCSCLSAPRERFTNERGIYSFDELPAGNYTIQVLAGRANLSKVTELPRGAKFRANFSLDPRVVSTDVIVVYDARRVPDKGWSNCGIREQSTPIHFRTTVGNSLRDAVEASTYHFGPR
jgi:hypothetical protein